MASRNCCNPLRCPGLQLLFAEQCVTTINSFARGSATELMRSDEPSEPETFQRQGQSNRLLPSSPDSME
jgi:hypothetical protein